MCRMKGCLREGAVSLCGSSESERAGQVIGGFLEQAVSFQGLYYSCNGSSSLSLVALGIPVDRRRSVLACKVQGWVPHITTAKTRSGCCR